MVFFTSDHHFYHTNVIKYCDRPYDEVEFMNEDLCERWNQVVKPEDTVYHLGDFSMAFRPVEFIPQRLNGTIYLIPGNHDFCHTYHKKSRKSKEHHDKWINKYEECGFKVLPEKVIMDFEDLKDVSSSLQRRRT